MKQLFITAMMTLFILGLVACGGGGSDAKSVIKDMTKAMDEYAGDMKKVKSADDVVAGIESLAKKMKDLKSRAKDLPNFKNEKDVPAELKEDYAKLKTAMGSMMKAMMSPDVMKFMQDPKVQAASKKLGEILK